MAFTIYQVIKFSLYTASIDVEALANSMVTVPEAHNAKSTFEYILYLSSCLFVI